MRWRPVPFTVTVLCLLAGACSGHQSSLLPSAGAAKPFALQSNAPSPSPWQEEPNIGVYSETVGADGHSIWGSGTGAGIGRLDIPTNTAQFFGGPGASWQAATAGPNGLMWYCDGAGLHTIDDNGNTQTFTEPWDACSAIEVGPDGNLWLSADDPSTFRNEAYKVTPTGTTTEYVLPHDAGIALIGGVNDGNVWYAEAAESYAEPASYVAKITAATGVITEYPLAYNHRFLPRIVAIDSGHDGNVYIIDGLNERILRVSETGSLKTFFVKPAGNAMSTISVKNVDTVFYGLSTYPSTLWGWSIKGHVFTDYGSETFDPGLALTPLLGPDLNIWSGRVVYLRRILTTTPQSATVTVGASQPFTISEKDCPSCIWSAVSEEPQIASVSAVTGNSFSVTGVGSGAAQIDVSDKHYNVVHVDVIVN